jgi:hypothetical protein
MSAFQLVGFLNVPFSGQPANRKYCETSAESEAVLESAGLPRGDLPQW